MPQFATPQISETGDNRQAHGVLVKPRTVTLLLNHHLSGMIMILKPAETVGGGTHVGTMPTPVGSVIPSGTGLTVGDPTGPTVT